MTIENSRERRYPSDSERSNALWELTTKFYPLVAADPVAFHCGIADGRNHAHGWQPDSDIIAAGGSNGAYNLGLALAPTLDLLPESFVRTLSGEANV